MTDETTLQRLLREPWPSETRYRHGLDATRTGAVRHADVGPPDSVRVSSARRFPALRLIALLAALAIAGATLVLVVGQASPSPTPTPWAPSPPLAGDEVAPGVVRVREDGVGRDLQPALVDGMHRVAFTPDGGIGCEGPGSASGSAGWGVPPPGRLEGRAGCGPGRDAWAVFGGEVASFRDGAWTMTPALPGTARGVEVLPDGQVWASTESALARLDGDRWTAVPVESDTDVVASGVEAPAGVASALDGGLASTLDGSLWLRARPGDRLVRYDGSSWESIPFAAGFRVTLWAVGGDGVAWAYEDSGPGCGSSPRHRVARYEDGLWTVMPERIPGIGTRPVLRGIHGGGT